VDKTSSVKVLKFGRKLRHPVSTVLPQSSTVRYRKRLQYHHEGVESWEYRYKREELYSVTFWGAHLFVPEDSTTESSTQTSNRTESTVSTSNNTLKSCLKKKLKYPQSSNTYSGNWFGISFPTYIRRQVQRAREQAEKRQNSKEKFLIIF
jgi:hypothetical protein